jgi:hypothetical protein
VLAKFGNLRRGEWLTITLRCLVVQSGELLAAYLTLCEADGVLNESKRRIPNFCGVGCESKLVNGERGKRLARDGDTTPDNPRIQVLSRAIISP